MTSSWRRLGNALLLQVDIPADTTAEVDVPVAGGGTVRVLNPHGVHYLRTEGGYAIYTTDGGHHRFLVTQ